MGGTALRIPTYLRQVFDTERLRPLELGSAIPNSWQGERRGLMARHSLPDGMPIPGPASYRLLFTPTAS